MVPVKAKIGKKIPQNSPRFYAVSARFRGQFYFIFAFTGTIQIGGGAHEAPAFVAGSSLALAEVVPVPEYWNQADPPSCNIKRLTYVGDIVTVCNEQDLVLRPLKLFLKLFPRQIPAV